jgi:hypothetical protein
VRAALPARPDLTLEELLMGRSSVDRFLEARWLARNESRSKRPSKAVRMSPPHGRLGVPGSPRWRQPIWSSSVSGALSPFR